MEVQRLCAICNLLQTEDSDLLLQQCCENVWAHESCMLRARRNRITIKCDQCLRETFGTTASRQQQRRATKVRRPTVCWWITMFGLPLLTMMLITSYIAPALIYEWYWKKPYKRTTLSWVTTDMQIMLVWESVTIFVMFVSIACCVCWTRQARDACQWCCCCCGRLSSKSE